MDAGADDSGIPHVTSAVALSRCGGDVVDPSRGVLGPVYTANVALGSQAFGMLLDTGSSRVVVASSTCTDCSGVSPLYSPDADAQDTNQKESVLYGAGALAGELYDGTAKPGDGPGAPVTFLAVDTQNGFFSDNPLCSSFQGVFGLGDPLPNEDDYFPGLVQKSGVADVFSISLCDAGGSLWLGGYDPSATDGAPQFTPLAAGYRVALSGIAIDGTDVAIPASGLGPLRVDTGEPLVRLPSGAFNAVTKAIGDNAQFKAIFGGASWFTQFPPVCVAAGKAAADLDAALPHMTIKLGSNPTIAVDARATVSYLQRQASDGAWCPGLAPTGSASGGGGGGGGSGGSGNDAGILQEGLLGDSFLRSSVVIFDRKNQRLGLAPHTCP